MSGVKVTLCTYDGRGYIGGPYTWLQRLAPMLCEDGFDVRALFLLFAPPEHCDLLNALQRAGVTCRFTAMPRYTEQRVQWILSQLAADPPDIFIPNVVAPAFYAAGLARAAGIETVGILHSDDAFHHGLLQEFVFGSPAYRLSALVCVSQFLEQMVRAQYPPATQVWRIPYGAPVPREVARQPAGQLRLAYVGRLDEEQKRISELTRALCRVTRTIPSTEGLIYGSGPARASVEQILRDEAADLPVRLVGKVESDQIQQQLLSCHALVLLSDYEGLPIALMEAMACGVVPICLRTRSGVAELVEHDITGLLVDDRGDSFLAAVRRLVEEPGLWERLSRAARAKIEAEYSDQSAAVAWEQLLLALHSEVRERRPLRTPTRLALPPVHPGLAREDHRRPPAAVRLLQQGRYLAGRIRYRLRQL